jgi:hypothetical protein
MNGLLSIELVEPRSRKAGILAPNVQHLLSSSGWTLIHADKRRFFFLNQRDQRFSASKSLTLKKELRIRCFMFTVFAVRSLILPI